MKRILLIIVSLLLLIIIISCEGNPIVEELPTTPANSNSASNTGNDNDNTAGDNNSVFNPIIPEVSSRNLVEIKTENETVDGENYVVKHFAEVQSKECYFYTYYKFYYYAGQLKMIHVWNHNVGSCQLVPYTSFREHYCSSDNTNQVFIYYENGQLEYQYSYSYYNNFSANTYSTNKSVIHYLENGIKEYSKYYIGDLLSSETHYFTSEELRNHVEYSISYNKIGVEVSRQEYTYYSYQVPKTYLTYTNGLLYSSCTYSPIFPGFEIERCYNSGGKPSSRTEYEYDEYGNKNREKDYSYTNDIEYLYREQEYYTTGVVKSETYYSGGVVSHVEYYNENGALIDDIRYSSGTEYSRYKYEYYANGNKKSCEEYSKGVISSMETYSETFVNKKILEISYSSGSESSRTEYEYFDSGNKKREASYAPNGNPKNDYWYYDLKQSTTRVSISYNGGSLSSLYIYYESGNKNYTYSSSSGKLYTYPDGSSSYSSSSYSSSKIKTFLNDYLKNAGLID